jgi:iron(III) transport system substrate-binding protein
MSRIIAAASGALFAGIMAAIAQVPDSYPAGYAAVVDAANQEGKLVVYSTTDSAVAAQLLRDFAALYPRIAVDYFELNSGEIYKRYLGEIAAGVDTADVLWASSMDGQLKMAAEGHAAT